MSLPDVTMAESYGGRLYSTLPRKRRCPPPLPASEGFQIEAAGSALQQSHCTEVGDFSELIQNHAASTCGLLRRADDDMFLAGFPYTSRIASPRQVAPVCAKKEGDCRRRLSESNNSHCQ